MSRFRSDADAAARRDPLPAGFWVLWTTVVIDMVGFGMAIPVLGPLARDRLHASELMVGVIGAAFSLAQFVMSPVLGRVADRIGRRPVLVLSLLGTAVASFGTATAAVPWALFAWRALDGASGATVGVAQTVVADLAPPQRRAALMGMIGAGFGVGFTIGPAFGALTAHVWGYRAPFVAAGVVAALNAIATWIRLPETRGLAVIDPAPVGDASTDDALARTWRDNGVAVLFAISALTMFAASGFEQTYALFAEDRLGFKALGTGLSLALVGVIVMVVQGGLIRPAVARSGEGRVLQVSLLVAALGFVVLGGATGWFLALPGLVILSLGRGFSGPTLTALTVNRIHPSRRASLQGVGQSWGSLARVVGPIAGGWAYQHLSPSAPLLGAGMLFGVALALTALW